MKKKFAKARQPKPRKVRRAAAAASLSAAAAPVESCGDEEALSINAMLRAQMVETHLAAMDCLGRARTADSDEERDRALTDATRLLSLFTRQVNTLERGRGPMTAAKAAGGAYDRAAAAMEQRLAAAIERRKAPADDPAGPAAFAQGGGVPPARQNGSAPSGP